MERRRERGWDPLTAVRQRPQWANHGRLDRHREAMRGPGSSCLQGPGGTPPGPPGHRRDRRDTAGTPPGHRRDTAGTPPGPPGHRRDTAGTAGTPPGHRRDTAGTPPGHRRDTAGAGPAGAVASVIAAGDRATCRDACRSEAIDVGKLSENPAGLSDIGESELAWEAAEQRRPISERVIRTRLARRSPRPLPAVCNGEGDNAASRDAGAREPGRCCSATEDR